MAVEINVRGVQGAGSRESASEPTERLIEEARREIMASRSLSSEALDVLRQSRSEQVLSSIRAQYESRRQDMRTRLGDAYSELEQNIGARRRDELIGVNPISANYSIINDRFDRELDRRTRSIGQAFDAEEEQLNKSEQEELLSAENELTNAVKELTEQLRQEGETANESSFINQLRAQRREALIARDNATTESEARAAQRDVDRFDRQLGRYSSQGRGGNSRFFDPVNSLIGGAGSIVGSIQGEDLGGLISGAGSTLTSLLATSVRGALRGNAIVQALALAGSTIQQGAQLSGTYADISRYRGATGGLGGREGRNAFAGDFDVMRNGDAWGLSPAALGLSDKDFLGIAEQRIRSSGNSDPWWYDRALEGVALERNLGLSENSTIGAAQFERYNNGTSITNALGQVVTILSDIRDSGVSEDEFARVQEKFDIYQGILSSYLSRTDRPQYGDANTLLAAFSSTNVTQDRRLGDDIATFQEALQNPMNERMQALIYGVVGDLFPETGGDLSLIDRALRDPANEGRILEAVVKQLENVFGGTDSQLGYFAFRQIFPGIAPDRLDEYVSGISSGQAGDILSGRTNVNSQAVAERTAENIDRWSEEVTGLLSELTKIFKELSTGLNRAANWAGRGNYNPVAGFGAAGILYNLFNYGGER